jgi:hypothetical protein
MEAPWSVIERKASAGSARRSRNSNKSLQKIARSTLWRTLAPCAGFREVDFCRTSCSLVL